MCIQNTSGVKHFLLFCLNTIFFFTYDQKNFEDLSLFALTTSVRYLTDKDLLLRAGIEVPVYVHHQYTNLWLVKIPSENWSSAVDTIIMEDENLLHIE